MGKLNDPSGAKPEVKQTDKKLGISLEMQNVTLLIISSAVSCLCVTCPLLAPIGSVQQWELILLPGVCTAVLALLLGEPPSCAIQSNPAAVAGYQQAWCYSQQKICGGVGHIPQSGCLRFVFSQFEQCF